ncbi:MAG TPA: hypothetical protein VGA37_14300 [Gemmatimonadales bacterium]
MTNRTTMRLVREGEYVAEVAVELLEEEGAWSPYISVGETSRLDAVREALRVGDLRRASELAERVYRLTPLSAADAR